MPNLNIKQNFLSPTGFRLVFSRLPNIVYFVQSANVPGMGSGVTEQPTPLKTVYRHGDRIEYQDFVANIRVDEYVAGYKEIVGWLKGLTYPEEFAQHANLIAGYGLYSDATLFLLDSKQNPGVQVKFVDMFPTNIGDIAMNTTESDINYVTCDITFRYASYTIDAI